MEIYTLYLLIEGVVCYIFAQLLLCYFVRKGTNKVVLVVALLTWILNFNMMVLLPYDICITNILKANPELIESFDSTKEIIKYSYKIFYWSIFFVQYLIIPLIKKYENSGHFTKWEKFLYSIKNNLLFYGAVASIAIVLYIWAWLKFPKEQFDFFSKNVFKINYIFGQSIVLVLLSYSIIKCPKNIYSMKNYEKTIQFYEWTSKNIKDKLYVVKNDLKESGYLLYSTIENLKIEKEMQKDKFFDTNTINNKKTLLNYEKYIQERFDYLNKNSQVFGIDLKKNYLGKNQESIKDIKSLIKLNKNIKNYVWDNLRLHSQIQNTYKNWSTLINVLIKANIYKNNDLKAPLYNKNASKSYKEISQTNTEQIIFDKNENTFIPIQNISSLKVWYYLNLRKIFIIIFSIIFFLLGGITILSEISISLPWNLSLFGILIGKASNVLILHLVAVSPVIFLFSMSLYTLFKLKISGYYGMYGNRQTDSVALLCFCSILCKIIFPLCLNITLMIDQKDEEEKTILAENFGINNKITIINIYNTFSPLVFIGLMLINVFNLSSRIGKCFGLSDFDIQSEKRDMDIQEGHDYLMSLNKKYSGQMMNDTCLIEENSLSSENINYERKMKPIETDFKV